MLTEHPTVRPALVRAHREELYRAEAAPDGSDVRSRFDAIVDEHGMELGAVTGRYKLIQTADIVGLIDLHTERVGMTLYPTKGTYRNGNAKTVFTITNREIPDAKDGGFSPQLYLWHGLGGKGGIRLATGFNIRICGNGMVMGKILSIDYAKHTQGVDLEHLVVTALGSVDETIDRNYRFVQAARRTYVDFRAQSGKIVEAAGKRRAEVMQTVLNRNESEYGQTAWGLIQAVTEVSTHHMSTRKDGTDVASADNWTFEQIRRIAAENDLVLA